MSKISAFSKKELPLISNATEIFKEKGKDIYNSFLRKNQDLESFAHIVSRTPSLKNNEKYGLTKRDISSMVDTLSSTGPANQLALPTRAILGRSFIITKINFYYFILKVLSSDDANNDLLQNIRNCCEKLVFSLMSEETYELIIENNLSNKNIIRIAADELSYLWEYRMDRNIDSFSPPLMALWRERCTVIPVLGTLKGTMEVLMLSSKLSDDWIDFLSKKANTNNMMQALEEFIFGLNHEEINFLRKIMSASYYLYLLF
jgi:predicted transcriptional regulator